jgi:hypothetical protein
MAPGPGVAHKSWKNRREERPADAGRRAGPERRIEGVVRAELGGG